MEMNDQNHKSTTGGTTETSSVESTVVTTENDDAESNSVKIRTIAAYWLLGMCNNYIYVIMLSGAHDIIEGTEDQDSNNNSTNITTTESPPVSGRNCHAISTGAILLADIIPTLLVKLIAPFLPFFIHVRVGLVVVANISALLLVANASSMTVALLGVCLASFGSGLGEITMLAYSTLFPLYSVAGWSSGTGGAGIAGAFAYAGMTQAGLTPSTALLVSLSVPILMGLVFWLLLTHPSKKDKEKDHIDIEHEITAKQNGIATKDSPMTLWEKFLGKFFFIPKILKYMIPVGLVYLFEYLINSGLFELIYFDNTKVLDSASQFRWYNFMYQVGVFVSRTSVVFVQFRKIYVMSILQGVNLVLFSLEAIYGFIPNVWIMFILIFWEGLLGGAAYVNTFCNISKDVEEPKRLFAMSIASVADTFGIVTAGFLALPVHSSICKLPFDPVFRWP